MSTTQLAGEVIVENEKNIFKLCETFVKSRAGKKYRISIGICKEVSPNRIALLKQTIKQSYCQAFKELF